MQTSARLLLVLLLPWAGPALAKDKGPPRAPHAAALVKLLEPIRAQHDVPGLAGAVVTHNGLVALGATGLRAVGAKAQVTTNDLWHIGSCTKSMTATLIGRLVDKGKLSWDTTLADVFPGVKMHKGWRNVTVSQLLRNRGGAPNGLGRDGLWARLRQHAGSAHDARRKLLLGVLKHAPESAPETKYEYSNAGFAIAGHMAETLTKTPYEQLIRNEIFKRLHMQSVGFGAPGSVQTVDQPRGHLLVDGTRIAVPPGPLADNPVAISPAGRVHLTLQDWARYVRFHLLGIRNGVRGLLRQKTLLEIQQGRKDQDYAMGWRKAQRPWGGGQVLTHSGSNTMWKAVAWLAPKKGFAVIVACNLGGEPGTKACDQAAWALIQWHLAQKKQAAEKK